ncbi:MAG: KpsF/GutQ family sugar-phosphate isomerase [Marinosulfonomonas sp.]|nr:MAG: KpsF/GutQ family sugar-phosphate isomerase [Marinosulfonomonas sp.]
MNKDTVLSTGRRVISQEADALTQLANSLGDGFSQAVELMQNAKGRVVVSGMGKSGHIARKIAATLASTGTPAFFIHPAEASHGDLGMMTQDDVALVLSNSGETPELSNIIAYTRRFSIPMIGVASRAGSTLIRQSDVAILLPDAEEVCPMGLAPTTSTTMTLALGDALAVALMEHQKITPERYRDFHPGGNLGARLSKVSDLMHSDLPLAATTTSMGDALITISQKGFGVVGVCDDSGDLLGIITDGDLRRNMDGLLDLTVKDVMTPDPSTISPDALAEEAVAAMNERKITCLFVVDKNASNRAVGILHIHDCLRVGLA